MTLSQYKIKWSFSIKLSVWYKLDMSSSSKKGSSDLHVKKL